MTTNQLLQQVKEHQIIFKDVLNHIESLYEYTPTAFANGMLQNFETENQGSAKVLYFAHLEKLSEKDTLALFAEHYENVLHNPEADAHQNIRQFIKNGWEGVSFQGTVLHKK